MLNHKLTPLSHCVDQVSPVDAVFVEYTVQECSVPPADETLCVSNDSGKGVRTYVPVWGTSLTLTPQGAKVSRHLNTNLIHKNE